MLLVSASDRTPRNVLSHHDCSPLSRPPLLPRPMADPEEKTASTRVVLDCMERLERLGPDPNIYMGGLYTAGNPWEFPPAAVVVNGRESIRKYYDTWEQCDFSLVEINALKVVFVGAYAAGKTR